jgi:hypothetical protein
MPDTSPIPVDIDAIERSLADGYVPACTSAELRALIMELRFTRAELRSRASIGPDSERIRELEVENARLRHELGVDHTGDLIEVEADE